MEFKEEPSLGQDSVASAAVQEEAKRVETTNESKMSVIKSPDLSKIEET